MPSPKQANEQADADDAGNHGERETGEIAGCINPVGNGADQSPCGEQREISGNQPRVKCGPSERFPIGRTLPEDCFSRRQQSGKAGDRLIVIFGHHIHGS